MKPTLRKKPAKKLTEKEVMQSVQRVSNGNYVCCKCRRSTRGQPCYKFTNDMTKSGSERASSDKPVCPECGDPMKYLGKRWRVPKRKDKKAWKIVEQKLKGRFLP